MKYRFVQNDRVVNGAGAASGNLVIAISLYGSDIRNHIGAIRNAQLALSVYPGWSLRVYCEPPEPPRTLHGAVPTAVLSTLRHLNAQIFHVGPEFLAVPPKFWRFHAIVDLSLEAFIVRDADGRLTSRDAAAVNDWLRTHKAFHCIRDHPAHEFPIMGGLWGGRPRQLAQLFNSTRYVNPIRRQSCFRC